MTFFTMDVTTLSQMAKHALAEIKFVTVCEFPTHTSLSTWTMHMEGWSVTDPGTCEICTCSRLLLFLLFNSVLACSAANMAAGGRFEYLKPEALFEAH